MNFLIPIISGILGRLDGWGDGDPFLNIWPFKYIRGRGINYSRYAIGFVIWAITGHWIYALTYPLAVALPYGEKHWWMQAGILSWFMIGALYGAASLSWGNALFCGMLVVGMKFFDTDQSIFEFLFYSLGTIIFIWR